ncbi:uncharacterized protein LOC123317642 [Coccinella septempunctata]|uniref:uncharacterized protein LOC123317642 n=2 Tax=Coccinella septempunctata TaxID=41139 RepID=UPI001D07CA2B|nr:uncharacterized protein LOC123317642 [Coccinella septempunctata]
MYPIRPSYAQLLSNRVRWMIKGEKLSRAELSNIKASCYPLEAVQNMSTDMVESSPRRSSLRVRRSGLYLRDDLQTNKMEEEFVGNWMKFSGLAVENRPKIPRIQHNKGLLKSVKLLNSVLPKHFTGTETLSELVDIVYAGAVTVSEAQGYQVSDNNSRWVSSPPPWKRRLESKIVKFRKKIGTFYTYLSTPHPSTKLMKNVKKLASEFRIKRRDPLFKDKIALLNDTLKQKIKALGNRIRRYNEKEKRIKNNRMFHQNQKKFFRDLEQKDVSQDVNLEPMVAEEYWSGIWSKSVEHNEHTSWMGEAETRIPQVQMDEVDITVSDIEEALKGTNNWATPGCDKLHNYWWKHFTNIHEVLSLILKKSLTDPLSLPPYLTQGLTYLIPKAGDLRNPNNYRPITCLPAVYKILTSVITKHIHQHLRTNNLMAPEQGGGRIRTKGSKELLIVDYIVTKQARKKLRNISVAWIDYRKAFDSVPHTWLLKVLKMHGVHEKLIHLLRFLMQTWRTSLLIRTGDGMKQSRSIKIRRGVFQGDTLSAIWFCMAINPLSALLRNTEYGYVIDKQRSIRINHSLYIDDLKLYGANFEQIKRLLEIVSLFSESIGMSFGVDKCATLEVRRGKIQNTSLGTTLMNQTTIPSLNVDDSYKYLGIKQALDIKTSEMKELYREKILRRVNILLRSKLNSRSLFTAINIWAIPTVAYSFGIITWSTTDLQEMDRALRRMLTKHGVHHPHSSTIRLYLPRHQGGRGLLSLEKIHQENITTLRNYFLRKNSPFFQAIREADRDISALRLSGSYSQPADRTVEELIEEWSSKALHGRYPGCLKKENINKKESLTYLTAGYLFPETEGRLLAIQDQVVPTRMYQKSIAKLDVPSDRCRKCSQAPETLQHVTSSCPILAPRDYLERHNSMARIYHQQVALKLGLLQEELPSYIYVPKPLLQNARYRLYYDSTLVTDRAVMHNRPDIALFDTEQKTCMLIEFTIPADDNIAKAYTEKITKYGDLAFQLRELYNLRTISILPMIISVNGLVETHLLENTKRLRLEPDVISASQKQVILYTTRIVRKFLQGF